MSLRISLSAACFVLTFAGMGCVAKPEFTGRVSVLTYDSDDPSYLTPEIEMLIREANADIVCVQEARSHWCRDFKRQFRTQYPESLFVKQFISLDFQKQPAFFSKYALRPVQYVPPLVDKQKWSYSWIVEADTPAGPVQIANVRLQGGLAEMDAVCAAMRPEGPSIIAGEFSRYPNDNAVQRATAKGYTDVLPRFDALTPTWQIKNFVVRRAQRDHILCSSHYEPVAAKVLLCPTSEHSPVWAELKLVTPTTQLGKIP